MLLLVVCVGQVLQNETWNVVLGTMALCIDGFIQVRGQNLSIHIGYVYFLGTARHDRPFFFG